MRKGQAAMEFLMTYGWAILVVLISVGALAYFGVLNPDKLLGEKCVLSSGSGLWCEDYNIRESTVPTGINLRIRNILSKSVYIQRIEVVDASTVGTCTYIAPVGGILINADSSIDLRVPPGLCVNIPSVSMKKIKGSLSIDYNQQGGLTKRTTGTLIANILP